MILLAIAAAAQPVPQSLMDAQDDANLAYVGCLFSVTREAGAERVSTAHFDRRLSLACKPEERRLRELGMKVLRLRGDPQPSATIDALIRGVRGNMVANYARQPEIERALEEYAAACRARPEVCEN